MRLSSNAVAMGLGAALLGLPAQADNPLCAADFLETAAPQALRQVLAAGADPNERCMPDGGAWGPGAASPIYGIVLRAVYSAAPFSTDDLERLRILLEAGADPNLPDARGDGLLPWVVLAGWQECLDLLLKHGADPNRSEGHSGTVLHLAASGTVDFASRFGSSQRGQVAARIVALLLAAGADPNARDGQGRGPLFVAARDSYLNGTEPGLALLLAAGADPNLADDSGRTALHVAAEEGTAESLRLLLQAGADPDVPDLSGVTPRDIARQKGRSALLPDEGRKPEKGGP